MTGRPPDEALDYDGSTKTVTIDPLKAAAFQAKLAHYSELFAQGKTDYSIPAGAVSDPDRLHHLSAFFFWTSWAASTNRPDDRISYTGQSSAAGHHVSQVCSPAAAEG